MPYHYKALFAAQENPETTPNELVYHLSKALGYTHYVIHRALELVNPNLIPIDNGVRLEPGCLAEVEEQLHTLALSETNQALLTPTWTRSTITA